jgi:predicted dehydrogenase
MDKIGVGFAGAGWMGAVELKRLSERDDAEALRLFEPNLERGRKALWEAGVPEQRVTGRFEDLIEDPKIEAVWIVSPNRFHGEQSLRAMAAGKHVFCEKPCATTFREFRAQIRAEQQHPGLKTMVDYILYFDWMETYLRERIEQGYFGQITQIQVNYRHPINIAGDKVWKLQRDLMGDAIGMGIVHALFAIYYLMSPQAKPVGVFATSLPARVRGFEADPVWNILIRFDNGATGFCFGNIDDSNGYDAYHNLFGTEGGFVFDSQVERPRKVRHWSAKETGRRWVWPLDRSRCASEGVSHLAWAEDAVLPDSGDVIHHQTAACVGHFIDCIREDKKSPLSFLHSAAVAELGWAAQISAAKGVEVPLPLDYDMASAFFGIESQSARRKKESQSA